jgi:CHRD domain
MRRMGFVLVVVAASLALTTTATAAGGRTLVPQMTGTAEVPLGDPDGTGTASVAVNPGLNMVCWEIAVQNITLPATAAHIHIAPVGVAGPVVVPLSPPDASGTSSGCATVDRMLAVAIVANPAAYYVNVHNADFPSGAVRGQLG